MVNSTRHCKILFSRCRVNKRTRTKSTVKFNSLSYAATVLKTLPWNLYIYIFCTKSEKGRNEACQTTKRIPSNPLWQNQTAFFKLPHLTDVKTKNLLTVFAEPIYISDALQRTKYSRFMQAWVPSLIRQHKITIQMYYLFSYYLSIL